MKVKKRMIKIRCDGEVVWVGDIDSLHDLEDDVTRCRHFDCSRMVEIIGWKEWLQGDRPA